MLDRSKKVKDNVKAKLIADETVEDVYEIALLLDFYGQLLTERQYEIMDAYYNNDLSLGEIAEHLSISRQGVYDSVQKAKKALLVYENKLGTLERFTRQEQIIKKALDKLNKMGKEIPKCTDNHEYKLVMEILNKVLDTL